MATFQMNTTFLPSKELVAFKLVVGKGWFHLLNLSLFSIIFSWSFLAVCTKNKQQKRAINTLVSLPHTRAASALCTIFLSLQVMKSTHAYQVFVWDKDIFFLCINYSGQDTTIWPASPHLSHRKSVWTNLLSSKALKWNWHFCSNIYNLPADFKDETLILSHLWIKVRASATPTKIRNS